MTLTTNTPVEDHRERWGLWVKREDLCCPSPGPPFSKMRGVMAHVTSRPEQVIGVLDTSHSQAGHAVAYACRELGKQCVNFFPVRKAEIARGAQYLMPNQLGRPQREAEKLGALLVGLPAGRSAVLYHQAKKNLLEVHQHTGYMMPNALKLTEMIEETACEAEQTFAQRRYETVLIACSSATIAAGVMAGWNRWAKPLIGRGITLKVPQFILHQGYDRPEGAFRAYIAKMMAEPDRSSLVRPEDMVVISEGYGYADKARPGPSPDWPCNEFYDLKAFRWWVEQREMDGFEPPEGHTLMWNIG
jgi:hypothetical protein